ncbi:formate dehydrogenase accessory protein FdhE [[Haemophilus] ducreyi]|uniref:Protein FdhE homolog n=1 Tax=Haemophilus ducreyi (strain 35000HP / ATCC 700724) TaxID=233412 RepID=FDHE_HAEDU|nr:formate dehydrogenase accessory protein FdhE [[Haemophilus] ducreyi]Q7VM84.1 RecName: Full=Protein FdhE homolog [[Haemophilus] ducreyi 35000HP]AAP95976.1 formate dehydrogenase formation protein [[Haemophilus] ducreyi 35000HP]AKO36751.1 formate dehydrogenase [[Haemophilus] ducreyi]AKO38217.1 formate dehydrogenase [[Haemophilus] ducreyi]AKO39758.1 formate dehydrogenase [[Haemophilus] ducreyi]AKO41234.1 formate dehydrogenase [[Haemophilus] ducreyi]
MSIRILPENEIKPSASAFEIPPLLFANPKNLYTRRAKRLRELAKNNPLRDYLEFAAHLVDIQLTLLETAPIGNYAEKLTAYLTENQGQKPLNKQQFARDEKWLELLLALIKQCKPYATGAILTTLEFLEKASYAELNNLADHLLNERYEQVSPDQSVFIWLALSLYWTQLAQQLPRHTQAEIGERHTCPVCGSAPITSVIHLDKTQGLRYLHCALCESEWNMTRAQCSNCDESGDLNYWSFDTVEAPIKAESCGDCHSYLKVLYQEKDPYVEPLADDLASLMLDIEMEQKGFVRSGLNPFLFSIE